MDKVTGALYLGDLVRRILAQLTLDGLLFGAQPCEKLDQRDSFPAKYISEILRLVRVFYTIIFALLIRCTKGKEITMLGIILNRNIAIKFSIFILLLASHFE